MIKCALPSHGARSIKLPGTTAPKQHSGKTTHDKWNVNTGTGTKWLELDSYAIDHDWMPFTKGVSDLAAIGFADGTIRLVNKNGKV